MFFKNLGKWSYENVRDSECDALDVTNNYLWDKWYTDDIGGGQLQGSKFFTNFWKIIFSFKNTLFQVKNPSKTAECAATTTTQTTTTTTQSTTPGMNFYSHFHIYILYQKISY